MRPPACISLSSCAVILCSLLIGSFISPAFAASVTLNTGDGYGMSSFNSAGHWNSGSPPSAGNDYFTSGFSLRTPANSLDHTFAGDSLTISSGGAMVFKGQHSSGQSDASTITVGDLILAGGQISQAKNASNGNAFHLAGGLNISSSGGTLNAVNGDINIESVLSGSGSLVITSGGGTQGNFGTVFSNPYNSFTGNISVQNSGSLTLASTGSFLFGIGASGVNNSISGTNGQSAVFNGGFIFDLSGASTASGSSWTIVNVGSLAETFGPTFSVQGFTENNNVWTSGNYQFDEATGVLSVVVQYPSVTLNANDAFGASSFSSAGHWNDGMAPSSGKAYFTGTYMLRTPADSSSHTFAGHSLSIDGGGRLGFKGTSSSASLNIGDLSLNGGSLVNYTGGIAFNLAGGLNVSSGGGILDANGGNINVQSALTGQGTLIITSGSGAAPYSAIFSNAGNSFTGDISVEDSGSLKLTSAGTLRFGVGVSGVNNLIAGTNGQSVVFDGAFDFDLTAADTAGGSNWTLVDVDSLAVAFGTTFSVQGFTEDNHVWTSGRYQFSEATGVLSVVTTWTGAAGDGNYATAGNWSGGAAPADNDTQDTAVFNGGAPQAISVPSNRSVMAIDFKTAGWTLGTSSFSNIRTISSSGNGTSTMGLLVQLSSSGDFTWTVAPGNTLALTGGLDQRNSSVTLTGGGILQVGAAIGGDSGTVGSWGIHVVNGLLDIDDSSPYQSSAAGAVFVDGTNAMLRLQTTVSNAQSLITAGRIVDAVGNGLDIADLGGGAVGISSTPPTPVPPIAGNWTLTYDEEFNGFQPYLDGAKWRVGGHYAGIAGSGGNDPANLSVGGGKATLRSQVRNYSFSGVNYSYAAAEITTFKTFRQQYGYFEARIKYPGVTGLWPAFWLMPDRASYGWPEGYRRSYLKFDLSSANISQVTSAQLKLTPSTNVSGTGNLLVMKLRDNSWSESSLTWNNKPVPDPAWIKQYYSQTYTTGQPVTTDVTDFVAEQVAGDGKVSFVLADTFMKSKLVQFYSREAGTQSYRPQLVINGVTYYATEDSYVRWGSLAGTNYGSETVLMVQDAYADTASTYSGGMETDIMESLGIWGPEHTQNALHWDGYGADHQSVTSGKLSYPATGDGYHTYGVYWESGLMEFYVDGVKTWEWANSRVCSVPCYLLLSLQLGGWDNNNPGSQVNDQTMQVDWVRVWSGTKSP